MAAVIPQGHFRITKGEPKMFARRTSPVKTMKCWFCPDCGTRLYHVPGGAAYPNRNDKPGTLDDTSLAHTHDSFLDAQCAKVRNYVANTPKVASAGDRRGSFD
jgi:hypothetical protein